MIEKLIEMFTPEVTTVVIVALAALTIFTFLMLLITFASLSRAKKRLFNIAEKSLALEEKQATFRQEAQRVNNTIANFAQTTEKIESMDHRLDELGQKIFESQNLLAGLESTLKGHESTLKGHESALKGYESTFREYESKQKEHETLLGKAGKMMGKEAANFTQVVERIRNLEDDLLSLKVFQRTFEITRNQILNVLVGKPINMPSPGMLSAEHKNFNDAPPASSESQTSGGDEAKKPRMNRF